MPAHLTLPPVAVLCGGKATRLKPISDNTPKALVEVGGKPFIVYQLEEMQRQHISDVILCVGYKGEMIEEAVGDGRSFNLTVRYSYDGDVVLGTGGALRKAMPLLGREFFVLYGDAYLRVNYELAYRTYLDAGKQGLMTVFHNADQLDSSNVVFENQQILLYSKTKKTAQMRYIDYGLGILQAAALQSYSGCQQFDLALVYEQLAQDRELAALEVNERFYEIGSHHGLKEFRDWLGLRTTGSFS